MKKRNIALFGILAVFIICTVSQGVFAEDNGTVNVDVNMPETTDEDDPAAFGVTGVLGDIISTVFWVIVGCVLILGAVGVVDLITDRFKHNWLNLEELAGNPTAMAIIAAGLMIAIAIVIHGATLG